MIKFSVVSPSINGRLISSLKVQKYTQQGSHIFLIIIMTLNHELTIIEELEVV